MLHRHLEGAMIVVSLFFGLFLHIVSGSVCVSLVFGT